MDMLKLHILLATAPRITASAIIPKAQRVVCNVAHSGLACPGQRETANQERAQPISMRAPAPAFSFSSRCNSAASTADQGFKSCNCPLRVAIPTTQNLS